MPLPPLLLEALGTETTADAFERQAAANPDGEAVVDSHTRLTWGALNEQSDRLALALLELGAERGDVALVQLPPSVDLYRVRLACEKAGIVLAAVPPTFRHAELRALVGYLRPTVAFTAGVWRDYDYAVLLAEAADGWPLRLIVRADAAASGPTLAELTARRPATDPAYLRRTRFNLFERSQVTTTSGSTGVPKCAEVPLYARPLTGWVQARRYGVRPGDTLAAFTSVIAGTGESLVYHMGPRLGTRGALLEHFEADAACALLARERVAGATVVPTLLVRLAAATVTPDQFPALRFFANYGALLATEHARVIEQRYGAHIVQAYGTSDYGGIAATAVDDPAEVRWSGAGRPLEGNELRIADDEGHDVPPGAVGRLYVRGAHAVSGYYRGDALNRAAWASGWFDLEEYGRLDPSGNLFLTGRARDLIIRGGQNIFPHDVEHLLVRHPAVAEAAVVGMPDAELGERVCAYIVPHPTASQGAAAPRITDAAQPPDAAPSTNTAPTADAASSTDAAWPPAAPPTLPALVAFLRDAGLAPFKLPERLEIVDRLPIVPVGNKVDKRRLAEDIRTKLAAEGPEPKSARQGPLPPRGDTA